MITSTPTQAPVISGPSRANILVLTHRVPFPPDKGDRIRAHHILKWLSARASVHLACLADEPIDAPTRARLAGLADHVEVVPHDGPMRWARGAWSLAIGKTASAGLFDSPLMRDLVDCWGSARAFDAAFASASSLVPYLRRKSLRDVPAVVDLVDVDSQKWLDYGAGGGGPKAWLHRAEGTRLRELERAIPTWARAVTLVSPAEVALYRQVCGVTSDIVHAIGNGVDLEYFRAATETRPGEEHGCVFVGALDYRPNVEGATWFCREVWPGILRRRPGATLTLVGRRPVAAVRRLAESPGIVLVGQVPDVRPYLARAAVAVVPLHLARGVQNKVLEAMAMGKPVVSSAQAVLGLRAEHGRDLLVISGSDSDAWIRTVSKLLDHPARRAELGLSARSYVESNHCWNACLAPFGPLFGLTEAPKTD